MTPAGGRPSRRVVTRKALPDDIHAIIECDSYAGSHADRRELIEAAVMQGSCLVAVVNNRIIGFIVVTHDFFHHGFIPVLVVAQIYRRKGIGLQLLAAAEAVCTSDKLFTSTNSSNAAAQSLLTRAGFVRSGLIENLDHGDPELVYFKRVH